MMLTEREKILQAAMMMIIMNKDKKYREKQLSNN